MRKITALLGEITDIINGTTPESATSKYWNGHNVWITPTDLGKNQMLYLSGSERKITEEGFKSCNLKKVSKGAVVMSSRAPIGHLAIAGCKLFTNQGCKSFVPLSNMIDSEFLYFLLKHRMPDIQALGSGATFLEVSKSMLENFVITFPESLVDQRNIAAQLKSQFAAVETARKALEIQENDVNKLEIQLLESIFSESKPEKFLKIGDVAITTSGSTPSRDKNEYWQDGYYAWIKTGEVVNKPIFKAEESISEKALKECSVTLLPPKTVLIAMYGQGKTRGQSAVLEIPATTNQACFAILPNETFYPEYLQYWLKNSYANLRSLSEGRGGNQANLNGAMLKDFTVPFISKDKQIKMVDTINTMLNEMEKVKTSIQATKKEIASLPNLLLAQAFDTLSTP